MLHDVENWLLMIYSGHQVLYLSHVFHDATHDTAACSEIEIKNQEGSWRPGGAWSGVVAVEVAGVDVTAPPPGAIVSFHSKMGYLSNPQKHYSSAPNRPP